MAGYEGLYAPTSGAGELRPADPVGLSAPGERSRDVGRGYETGRRDDVPLPGHGLVRRVSAGLSKILMSQPVTRGIPLVE